MCVIPVVCVTIKTIRPLKGHSSVKFNMSHKLLRPMDELDFSEPLQRALETGSQLTSWDHRLGFPSLEVTTVATFGVFGV